MLVARKGHGRFLFFLHVYPRTIREKIVFNSNICLGYIYPLLDDNTQVHVQSLYVGVVNSLP